MSEKKVLHCYSKGDKRFSALFAKVSVFGVFASIEEHYQRCKRFVDDNGDIFQITDWTDAKGKGKAKGKEIPFIVINGIQLPTTYLTPFYKLLWVKYLDSQQGLVDYAKGFDEFLDIYKGKSQNCQADVIEQYVKEGRQSIMKECQPLIRILNGKSHVLETVGDILGCRENIIGHQVNAQGVMGSGLAKSIKARYPEVFQDYLTVCQINRRSRSLMGMCLLSETKAPSKWVANLFGQFEYGGKSQQAMKTGMNTEYDELRKALESLKQEAKEKGLSVALPWQLGSGLAGGSWDDVRQIIEEVFHDYYVTIYRLPETL